MQYTITASQYMLPQARSIESGEGTLHLHLGSAYCLDPPFTHFGPLLEKQLGLNEGCEDLYFTTSKDQLGPEEYQLKVTREQVIAKASTPQGMFQAIQTIRQLYLSGDGMLPVCRIEDSPLYSWRGFMLDTVGHFFSKEEIKKLIDVAAMHHLNVFHWLLEKNHVSRIGSSASQAYTKEDIKEITDFASQRYVTVLPCGEETETIQALITMFPGKHVHVGSNPEAALLVKAAGKRAIAWDGVMDQGKELDKELIIATQSCEEGKMAVRDGHQIIICSKDLDSQYEENPEEIGTPHKTTTMEECASFNPSLGFEESEIPFILGGQANLWTDWVHNGREAEYLLWPRLALIAERVWRPQEPQTLEKRMRMEHVKLDALDVLSWRGDVKKG